MNPEGQCFAFDSRGVGYGRGEGVGTVILKRLSHAIEDGDLVHAVILNSALNQDGKTAGITLPNPEAQAALIKHVYESAEIDPAKTLYVEAHGTVCPPSISSSKKKHLLIVKQGTQAGKCSSTPITFLSSGTLGFISFTCDFCHMIHSYFTLENQSYQRSHLSVTGRTWKIPKNCLSSTFLRIIVHPNVSCLVPAPIPAHGTS